MFSLGVQRYLNGIWLHSVLIARDAKAEELFCQYLFGVTF